MSLAAAASAQHGWTEARLVAREAVTAGAALFRFAVDWPRPHRAGQHVELRLTAPDGHTARRFYSIASAPSRRGSVDLVIALAGDGEVSRFFHDVAETGDLVEMRGPFGLPFSWAPEDGGPLLLVGGGSGVVPLLSMLRERAAAAPHVPAALLYAARARDEAPYLEELEVRAAREPGFGLALRLSRGTGGRRIDRAAVAETLDRLPAPPRHAFVCGSTGFVEAATDFLLDAGVSPGAIQTERFG